MFTGIITALITPFRDKKVDEQAFADFVSWQIDQGVDGIAPCGTTGEGNFLSHEEQKRLIDISLEVAQGRVKVLAGTAAISTDETIQLTQQAQACGVDGVFISTPWYVRPSQESLVDHFTRVHDATDVPMILYNNPVRTGVNVEVDTMVRIGELKRMVGLKDASHDMSRVQALRAKLGPEFSLLAGDDPIFATLLASGGDGVISSSANAVPRLFAEIQKAWNASDTKAFGEFHNKLYAFLQTMKLASNPQPVKFAVSLMNHTTLETRLPYAPLGPEACEAIRQAFLEAEQR